MNASSTPERIAVLGEALFDLFPGHDVIGGAPFNVARNLAALGAAPLMVTRIGSDRLGDAIAAEFARFGLEAFGLQRDPLLPTGTVRVHMEGTSHRFEIVEGSAWDALDTAAAVDAVRRAAPGVVYFGTLAQRSPRSRAAIRAAIDAAAPATRFLDLNLRDGPDNRTLAAESLRIADRVKVNDDELAQLVDWFVAGGGGAPPPTWGEPKHRAAVDALAARFDVRRLVITRGGEGWACLDRDGGDWLEGSAPAVEVVDTVGAGDAFASVLLLGDLHRWPLPTTLRRAAAFASSVCGIQGAVDTGAGIYRAAQDAWAADRASERLST